MKKTKRKAKRPLMKTSYKNWPKEPLEVTDKSQIFKIVLMFVSIIGGALFAVRVLALQHEILDVLRQILAK